MSTKNKFMVGLAILAMLAAGCAEEEQAQPNNGNTAASTLSILVEDAANSGDSTATRAAYSGLATTFENGDAIGLYAVNASGTVMASNAKFTKSGAAWTSTANVVFNPEWSYYAYYPWVESPYTPDFSESDVDDIFADFISDGSSKFHLTNQGTKANYGKCDLMAAQGSPSGDKTVIFSMYHKKGLAVLDGPGMPFTTFSGNIPYINGGKAYYLMKPNTTTTVGGYSLRAGVGRYVKQVLDMETVEAAATDISMYNTAGTLQASRNTANCYMVHNAGVYKLPLVYGNAIKNGTTNALAYTPAVSGTYVLSPLVNHADEGITDPWIKNNSDGSGSISVDEAELLWQDKAGLVTAVGVSGDYLVFKVPTAASASHAGNAVVAAKDDGTIVWSWHIWVTTETYASTTTVTTSANTYYVAPVNLGWVTTGGEGKQGYCPYYQWGRKDPFLPSNGSRNTDHTAYDINGNSEGFEGIEKVEIDYDDFPGIAGSIMYPKEFYYDGNEEYYRWYEDEIANLWDINRNSWWSQYQTNKTVKTVYDPCPAGFCVPTQNLYWYYLGERNMEDSGGIYSTYDRAKWDGTNEGIKVLSSIWYPAAGTRYTVLSVYGTLSGVRTDGLYWSASPDNEKGGKVLVFNGYSWYCQYRGRTNGGSVRPVME